MASEAREQATVIEWANIMSNTYPCLKLLFHIPNGGSRNVVEAVNLKRQGVKAGVPDLFLPYPAKVGENNFPGLFIEMKTKKGKPTDKQKQWLEHLTQNGYYTAICHSADEAINTIKHYLGVKS